MASKQPVTSQQLAYLDELKQRLQELRRRQETFMEETAEILRNINPDLDPEVTHPAKPNTSLPSNIEEEEEVELEEEPGTVENGKSVQGSIKQLIRRFEALRQTSQTFNDQSVPQELASVDVRRLLNGYESLIVEGKRLQKNWMQLKKTSENCAQLYHWGDDDKRTEEAVRAGAVRTLKISIESKLQRYAVETKSGKREIGPSHMDILPPKVSHIKKTQQNSKQIAFCIASKKDQCKLDKEGSQRFGAMLQLLVRANPFNKCGRRKAAPP